MNFLYRKFPFVYDFIQESQINLNDKVPLAGIGIKNKIPDIHLNVHRLTYLKENVGIKWDASIFYETLACLLWHEILHIQLRHFAVVSIKPKYANKWNIVQDMVIDNIIHSEYPGWRNWKEKIDEINAKIDELKKGDILEKISFNKNESQKKYIGNLTDKDLMRYFTNLNIDENTNVEEKLDEHLWNDEDEAKSNDDTQRKSKNGDKTSSNSGQEKNQETNIEKNTDSENRNNQNVENSQNKISNESNKKDEENKSSGNEIDERIIDKLENLARGRIEKSKKMPFAAPGIGDIITQKTGEGRRYNLLQILKRYIKKISLKQKELTWKKISKKQPTIRPGAIYRKQPGEIVFIVDTSGSMTGYLQKEFYSLIKSINDAFKNLAKTYRASFSQFYQIEADSDVRSIKEIKKLEELNELINKQLKGGGGTDYKPIFDLIIDKWTKETNSMQKLPDLILFLTDLEVDLEFLKDPKYSALSNRLVWLYTGRKITQRPPIGDICSAFPDDFGASLPYIEED
jgi:predicted metal-dependent peptidase